MNAQFLIPAFFAALAILFAGLASTASLGLRESSRPAQRAHWRIAAIFGVVSLFLFVYL